MKVMVTGAGGFVGTRLTLALLARGYQVQALYHHPPHRPPAGAKVFVADIGNARGLRECFAGVQRVYHLASQAETSSHSQDLIETNVTGTLNILHAALAQDCRMLHVSSHEVYGPHLYSPLDEKHPLLGQDRQATSRLAADTLAETFYRSFGLAVTVVRLFPLYGPGQRRYHWLASLIQQLLNASEAPDPESIEIDALYIDDAVKDLIALAEAAQPGEVFNLGSGQVWPLANLLPEIQTWLNKTQGLQEILAQLSPKPWQTLSHRLANLHKLSGCLDFTPRTDPHDGLRRTLKELGDLACAS